MTQTSALAGVSARASDAWLSPQSYWMPSLLVESAWHEHAPFAAWILDRLRPRTVVELGTHNGFSYFAWCECAERLGIDTTFVAIDSWEGDDQAGFYSNSVYDAVVEHNARYQQRSTLLRGYFADRAADIDDKSVDLLHIDGRHGYEDVQEDFTTYLPKVSSRGIVLFHDIAEHAEGFGVYRFWDEVSKLYPSFGFEHGHGLGVLFVGSISTEGFSDFLAAASTDGASIRSDYARLGASVEARYQDQEYRRREPQMIAARDEAANELRLMRETKAWRVTAPARFVMAKARGNRS
jgi:predicted O-methyltransferase YrrM